MTTAITTRFPAKMTLVHEQALLVVVLVLEFKALYS